MSSAEVFEELLSPFANFSGIVCDHTYPPTRSGGLIDGAFVYVAGFVVQQVLQKHLISFDESYHLLLLKNDGGSICVCIHPCIYCIYV